MSVESEILRIQHNIANTYAAVTDKGGKVPLQPTSANLAAAVASIPVGVTQEELSQALLTKQDKLVGAPGQVVGFNAQGAAQAVPGWSNPNLLDNGYLLDPINQRGENVYSNANSSALYSIDRWYIFRAAWDVSAHKLTTTAALGRIVQRLDGKALVGKTVTFSALVSSVEGGNLQLYFGPGDIGPVTMAAGSSGLISFTITMHDPGQQANDVFIALTAAGASAVIDAVKLELGPQQTLAHQDADGNWALNDPPPNKALELAKCQRYFRAYDGGRIRVYNFTDISRAAYDFCNVIFDQPMRVTPTGTVTYRLNDGEPQTAQLFTAMCGNQKITPDIQIPAGQRVDIVSYAVSADL